MPSVNVLVTLVETIASGNRTLSITVDPEPLIIANSTSAEDVDIVWTLDNTNAPSWLFATKGIVVKAPGTHFSDNHGSGNGKMHGWKRKMRNHKKFVYTVNVENVADGTTLSWDPKIYNN